jgi:hypothetical protein
MILRFESVREHFVMDLAPRVQGTGDFVGEYGYALCLLAGEKVRVLWDEGGVKDVNVSNLIWLVDAAVRG